MSENQNSEIMDYISTLIVCKVYNKKELDLYIKDDKYDRLVRDKTIPLPKSFKKYNINEHIEVKELSENEIEDLKKHIISSSDEFKFKV